MAGNIAVHRDSKYGVIYGNHASAADYASVASLVALNTAGLPEEAVVTFKKNAQLRKPPRFTGERMPKGADRNNDKYNVAPTVSISVPIGYTGNASTEYVDILCSAIFQDVTENATTPYNKIFRFPTGGNHPDFSANQGGFFTLVEETGVSAADKILHSCGATRASFSCDPGQNDGRLYLGMDCIGRYLNENISSSGYTGTLSYPSTWTYFNYNDLRSVTVDIGGGGATAIPCYGFKIDIDTGLTPTPTAGYHGTNGYNETNRCNRFFETSGTIKVLWNDTARSLIAGQVVADSTVWTNWVFSWAAADPVGAAGQCLLKLNVLIDADQFVGSEERISELTFSGFYDGTNFPVEFQYANAVDRGATYATGFWV